MRVSSLAIQRKTRINVAWLASIIHVLVVSVSTFCIACCVAAENIDQCHDGL